MSALPDCIFGHWVHSREEDSEDIMVYRPVDYDFPPARGREGFELRSDGTFVDHPIGPGDANLALTGEWQPKGRNLLEVSSSQRTPHALEVVHCDDNVLKIRRP
jgi:hypothetical protein